MNVSPEVEALMQMMAASGVPSFERLPIADARKAYVQLGAKLGGPSLEVQSVEELNADVAAAGIPLRLYRPQQLPEGPAPLVVYLHGGGWVVGGLDSHDKVCRRLAHLSGCAVLAVDYRLAPEHSMPTGAYDVIAVLHWLVRAATLLNIDPQRIAIAGDSAGASLSAVACLALRSSEVKLRAQVLFYPAADMTEAAWTRFPARQENADVPPLTADLIRHWTGLFLGESGDPQDYRISPLLADDHRDLPPALIVTAECDTLRDDGRAYCDALRAAGNQVEHLELAGMIHGFIEMPGALPGTAWVMERAATFLRSQLGLSPLPSV
ncbi:MAG: alpha/beta hydrolase [Pseudomonadales bacterium]